MILYSSPLACSSAAHLVLIELGIPHEIEYVDIYAQPHVLISDGTPFVELSPKNSVPALKLESGELLTEIGVIVQYLADLKPGTDLLPPVGTLARYRVMEWLSYVGSDLHKTIGPLFNPQMPEAAKLIHQQNLDRRLTYIDERLAHQSYLTGESFTVADAYLFVMIGWEHYFKFALSPYPNLARFHARISSRSSFSQLIQLISPALGQVKLPAFPTAKSRSAT